ncbi:MAG TPA: hypothetical protein PLE30_10580, partial [Candidatus Kapabacteria bacterium]|nr:hypothetical protein [Candidatus Kapabacteria bacterium]
SIFWGHLQKIFILASKKMQKLGSCTGSPLKWRITGRCIGEVAEFLAQNYHFTTVFLVTIII